MDKIILTFGFAIGIASHLLYFIHGEHHMQAPIIFKFYALVTVAICFMGHTLTLLLLYLTYFLGLFTSIISYRVFFHRLKQFPGPPLAKISKFWHVGRVLQKDNYVLLEEFRIKYGNYVRTGPTELTVFDPDILQAIHGSTTKCTKTDFCDVFLPSDSVVITRDKDAHRWRRHVWKDAFTNQGKRPLKLETYLTFPALNDYELRVQTHVLNLDQRISETNGKPFNATQLFENFGFDVMGDLMFGKSFNLLTSGGPDSHYVSLLQKGLDILGPLRPVPWLFILLGSIPGLKADYNRLISWTSQFVQDRIHRKVEVPDLMSWLLLSFGKSEDADQEVKYKLHYPTEEMHWLEGDALTAINAGSGTTSTTLVHIFSHLALQPSIAEKLRIELSSVPDQRSSNLATLTYLNAVITETLRLEPPVPSGIYRLTPASGLRLPNGTYLPGSVTIVAPPYNLQHLESCFPQPKEFIPERWIERSDLLLNKSAYAPFNLGLHTCLGKSLAWMELRAVTSQLVMNYDVNFADEKSEGVGPMRDCFTAVAQKLEVIFTPRKVG
ncbi:MAG: hypothetical protein MMC33_005060 [Icmadophila ericetorum]|nr:hypothetical protein [Icmadophila ericetorum]